MLATMGLQRYVVYLALQRKNAKNSYIFIHGAQINFGDLILYLTYGRCYFAYHCQQEQTYEQAETEEQVL